MPRPGVREGVRVGTGQWDRTATPNTLTEESEMQRRRMKRTEEKKKNRRRTEECSPQRKHVGITYIFITLSRTIFILDQNAVG